MRIKSLILILLSVMLFGCSVNSNEPKTSSLPPEPPTAVGKLEELVCYCFKAGKADAHLIYNSKFALLIDCGEKGFGKDILSYMSAHGIKKLDMLIITHFDKDHVGGAAKIINSVPIDRVFQSNSPKQSDEYENYLKALKEKGLAATVLKSRQSFRLDNAEISILPPMQEAYADDPSNNSSLITSVRYGSRSMLFTGDIQDARIAEYLSRESGNYDFLKVPYHGHYQNGLAKLFASVSPMIAVITSSDSEPEDARTLKLLADEGAAVYLTRTAPVIVKCDGETIAAYYDDGNS